MTTGAAGRAKLHVKMSLPTNKQTPRNILTGAEISFCAVYTYNTNEYSIAKIGF